MAKIEKIQIKTCEQCPFSDIEMDWCNRHKEHLYTNELRKTCSIIEVRIIHG